jgi:hypothetical protein
MITRQALNEYIHTHDAQPERIRHASSISRSLCLCSAAANYGSASAADLVLSSRDKEAATCPSETALGGGETRPLLVGGGANEGVM